MPMDIESGRILVFKNDKGGNEKRPDYRGELKTPDGQKQFSFSLWISESKAGEKYMSGQVEEIQASDTQAREVIKAPDAPDTPPTVAKEVEDDIPF